MGAWGACCVFDYARFDEVVVPAFAEGPTHPLLVEEVARARGRKRFVIDPSEREGLCHLFERVVTRQCVSHFANIGRRYAARHSLSLDAGVVGVEREDLVRALDERGAMWAHGSGGYGEGVRGWLTPDECRAFHAGIAKAEPGEECDEPEAVRERIARIQRVATLAVELGCGILWGIDLDIVYDRWREYDQGEHVVVEL